jgi:hypothetical protein
MHGQPRDVENGAITKRGEELRISQAQLDQALCLAGDALYYMA